MEGFSLVVGGFDWKQQGTASLDLSRYITLFVKGSDETDGTSYPEL